VGDADPAAGLPTLAVRHGHAKSWLAAWRPLDSSEELPWLHRSVWDVPPTPHYSAEEPQESSYIERESTMERFAVWNTEVPQALAPPTPLRPSAVEGLAQPLASSADAGSEPRAPQQGVAGQCACSCGPLPAGTTVAMLNVLQSLCTKDTKCCEGDELPASAAACRAGQRLFQERFRRLYDPAHEQEEQCPRHSAPAETEVDAHLRSQWFPPLQV